uniref:GCN5-related N-acetyltransferase n=1 Tax=Geobacter sp. (strain M21) TaxID=443144 RepID=C6E3G3_GEOSM
MDHVIDAIGKSPVQHGPRDEMAYLTYLDPVDAPLIVESLERLVCSRGYSKVVAKVPAKETGRFLAAGYQLEAALPCFSHEDDAACFMAKYFSSDRKKESQPLLVREVLAAAHLQQPVGVLPAAPADVRVFEMPESEYGRVAEFLCQFSDMGSADPSPVSATMRKGAFFLGAGADDGLSALARVTVDSNTGSAEITEVASSETGDEILVNHLLQQLERKLVAMGVKKLLAMARACSLGDNILFARNGYHFAGTLTNNTCRRGRMESANVWFKHLQEDPRMAWSSVLKAEQKPQPMQDSPFPPTLEQQ